MNNEEEKFNEAFRLIGEFLYHFALLEREMDVGIGKVLSLDVKAADVVTASMDFSRKLKVLYSGENAAAAKPDRDREKQQEKLWGQIMGLNNDRVLVAHSGFEPHETSGVVFRYAKTDKTLKIEDIVWSAADFANRVERAKRYKYNLHQLIDEMKPYEPSADFSDFRNSGLIAAAF